MKYSVKLFCCFGLLCTGCKTARLSKNELVIYENAVKDAMYPEAAKQDSSLVDISAENKSLIRNPKDSQYVLVVTWKTKNYYPDSGKYNTGNYEIWATAAPELAERMKQEKTKDKSMRLKQLLGLPPASQYNFFVEFWVKPGDLFRPCPDKEITDKKCNLCFSQKDSLDSAYIKWFNDTRISRYYACNLYDKYPWSELGYTYDWNYKNKSHKGLSEFVIRKNAIIYVNKVYTTDEYFMKNMK
jgi:hypothetical protein